MESKFEYKHNLNINRSSSQLLRDFNTGETALAEDFEGRLRDSQSRLVELQAEKEKIEQQAKELEEINGRKKMFFGSQVQMTEKLTNAVTLIDRELVSLRSEVQDLDQCRTVFDNHLNKIIKFDPDTWSRENLRANLDKSIAVIDTASDEYDQASQYFSSMRSAHVFSGSKKTKKSVVRGEEMSDFIVQLKKGLAFNLPIIVLAIIGLAVYFNK
jgi:DNA repair exonuclease SbcCD ATPase subunit